MGRKTDWADDIAAKLAMANEGDSLCGLIAEALRDARSEGFDEGYGEGYDSGSADVEDAIRSQE